MPRLMAAFDGTHMGTSGAVGIVASLQIEVVTETLLGLWMHADTAKGEQGLRHAGKITLAALTLALPLGFLTLPALAFGRTLVIELTPLPRVIRVGDGIRAWLEHRQEVGTLETLIEGEVAWAARRTGLNPSPRALTHKGEELAVCTLNLGHRHLGVIRRRC